MKTIFICFVALVLAALPSGPAAGWCHGDRFGGSTSHSYGSTSHTSAWGTSTSHTAGEGTSHTNEYGGSTRTYGEGTTHTNAYGGSASHAYGGGWSKTGAYGGTAYGDAHYGGAYYHPPAAVYPAYHPPATVNYYGSGCYNCGGWSTAGAAAAGAAVGHGHRRGHCLVKYRSGNFQRLQRRCCRRQRQHLCRILCGGCRRQRRGIYHGRDLCHAARRLRHTQRPGHDILPVRQHLVQAVLWRQRRLLRRGAYALIRTFKVKMHPPFWEGFFSWQGLKKFYLFQPNLAAGAKID